MGSGRTMGRTARWYCCKPPPETNSPYIKYGLYTYIYTCVCSNMQIILAVGPIYSTLCTACVCASLSLSLSTFYRNLLYIRILWAILMWKIAVQQHWQNNRASKSSQSLGHRRCPPFSNPGAGANFRPNQANLRPFPRASPARTLHISKWAENMVGGRP